MVIGSVGRSLLSLGGICNIGEGSLSTLRKGVAIVEIGSWKM